MLLGMSPLVEGCWGSGAMSPRGSWELLWWLGKGRILYPCSDASMDPRVVVCATQMDIPEDGHSRVTLNQSPFWG